MNVYRGTEWEEHTERKHGQMSVLLRIQKIQEWKNPSFHGYYFFGGSRKRFCFVLFRLDGFWFWGLFGCFFCWFVSCLLKGLLQPSQNRVMWMGLHLCLSPCVRQGLFVCCFIGQASWLTGLQGFCLWNLTEIRTTGITDVRYTPVLYGDSGLQGQMVSYTQSHLRPQIENFKMPLT